MIVLDESAINLSTFIIEGAFTDQDGAVITPTSLTWSLTDNWGNIINLRDSVVIDPPTDTFTVVLSGDDLDQEVSPNRIFIVEAVYTSITYGAGLPIKQQASFTIDDWTTKEPVIVP